MVQTFIALTIVAAAVGFAVRALVRTLKHKGGCSCGCDNCPARGKGCHFSDSTQLPEIRID